MPLTRRRNKTRERFVNSVNKKRNRRRRPRERFSDSNTLEKVEEEVVKEVEKVEEEVVKEVKKIEKEVTKLSKNKMLTLAAVAILVFFLYKKKDSFLKNNYGLSEYN